MKYIDRVYGEFVIDEPVILELIKSPVLLRLREIDQAGYQEAWFPGTAYSRFEHSVGVFLLLKMYQAPLAEQVAGLIHDVSHAAFSHCIDYVLAGGSEAEQSHQDNVFAEFVKNSEIPEILKKHGLELNYILDDRNFPLKEKDLPDLCADRLDYSLRTAVVFGEIENANYFLDHLITENNQWVFTDYSTAKKYAELFLKSNQEYYAGLPSAIMFRTVGDCLAYALEKKYISETDLYITDKIVLEKIKSNVALDPKLDLLFKRMNSEISCSHNPADYDKKVSCKSRMVDPLCRYAGEIKRISEIDSKWRDIIRQESIPKEYFLKWEK